MFPMLRPHMSPPSAFLNERFTALFTLEPPIIFMYAQVFSQRLLPPIRLMTHVADERALPCMLNEMILQFSRREERHAVF